MNYFIFTGYFKKNRGWGDGAGTVERHESHLSLDSPLHSISSPELLRSAILAGIPKTLCGHIEKGESNPE